ncbi:MAG: triosephosphate isomerase [Deltaproteobacteria bacterium]|nr:triosephosphate isomerase [Deltaproteobacteria bacterium]
MIPPLVVGNWKMHGTQSQCRDLARRVARGLKRKGRQIDVALAPPNTALEIVKKVIEGSQIRLAAQDAHWEDQGAFTGEVSAMMLKDSGCEFVILGHSERRHILNESDLVVAKKVQAALRNGLRAILCVGETLAERQAGRTQSVVTRQLRIALKGLGKSAIDNVEFAYEPVWAIGTGLNATSEQIARVHGRIRQFLKASFGNRKGNAARILYGGSVKPENAAEILRTPGVNGLLVGGASLRAETFLAIVNCSALPG